MPFRRSPDQCFWLNWVYSVYYNTEQTTWKFIFVTARKCGIDEQASCRPIEFINQDELMKAAKRIS